MKSTHITTAALLGSLTVLCGLTLAGIEGSKHDFSRKEWTGGDRCAACHVPHRSDAPKESPVWNPNADLNRTFGTSIGDTSDPGRGTLMCLRCHDGTIARDTIANARQDRFPNKHNPSLYKTSHGTTDHPVGVAYPRIDKGFKPMTSVTAGGDVRLPDGKVECVSCHDPHNTAGVAHFLVKSNSRSSLCLTCHKK
jgi:predicted CXXCH cytochrome family protein